MSQPIPATEPPGLRLSRMIVGLWVPQTVYAAAELGIADVLAEKPLPAAAVAEQLGTHPDATARLLRALVTLELLREQEGRFELTALGRCLESGAAVSRRAWSRLMGGPMVWNAWGRLVDCVRTGRKAYGAAEGEGEADTFEMDAEMADVFHQAMDEMTRDVAPGIVAAIDWRGVRRVVDVGGGRGALLCAILAAQPQLEGVVYDLPHARASALESFASRGVAARASFAAGSFFEQAPPAADAYVIKSVIHDWDDAQSLAILGRCREAMSENARLFLVESPVPDGPAPAGLASWFLSFSDLNMLINCGGRERTQAEYRELLAAAGLRTRAVHPTPGMFCVFEALRA